MEVGNKLNPQRSYRKGFALKGLRQHMIKTNNRSTIGRDELLTVRFPDLKENQVIIPGTTKLTFNITLAGTDANRTLVGNLGRNIIRKLVVKLEGNEIISIDDYDILYSYYGCWKCTTERHNAVFQGIVETDGQTENAIKHWINVGDKASNAKDQTVASIYDNRGGSRPVYKVCTNLSDFFPEKFFLECFCKVQMIPEFMGAGFALQ